MTGAAPWRSSEADELDELRRELLERVPDALLLIDRDGVVRYASRSAEQLFGRARDDVVGRVFGYPVVDEGLSEVELLRPGGSALLVELRSAEIVWKGEIGRIITLRDVTERRAIEQQIGQLERERSEAQTANRAKADFLAMMSHELRTPLNAILGYAELLELEIDGQLSTTHRQHIRRVRSSAKHLLALVNDVLDLSKLEAGRLTIQIGNGSIGDTLESAVEIVRPVADVRNISLKTHVERADAYRGDESRVRQILVNLLQNAVKFTPIGGSVTVTCGSARAPAPEARVARGHRYVYIEVRDTGIGIPANRLAAVFDPFVRVEQGHARRTDGSGLGLSISRRLARLMDGDITLESEPNRGSAFTLWLRSVSATTAATGDASLASEAMASSPVDGSVVTTERPGVGDAGEMILRETASIVASLVARLRHEREISHIEQLRYGELANHFGTFLAILSETLMSRAEQTPVTARAVEEGLGMLRLLADRHGRQRARMGWSALGVEREYRILQDEIERALEERAAHVPRESIEEARAVVQRLVLEAQSRSKKALGRFLQSTESDGDRR